MASPNGGETPSLKGYPVQSSSHATPMKVSDRPTQEFQRRDRVQLPRSVKALHDSADDVKTKARTIVVCLDGTGDKFDDDNSNIVHLVSCLKKDDKQQVSYYQAGIGTYGERGLSGGMSAALDMAVGSGLGLHVRDAYHFLMHTYKEGDKICLFGFSRGAYTARCLAGMVHKVGLLPPRNVAQIPFAYEFYKDDTEEGWRHSAEFKMTFCIDVNIYFVGVFDSVSSVGFIPRQLPLSSTPSNKSYYFRHAIALDERRAKFKPCRFQKRDWDDIDKLTKKPPTIGEQVAQAVSGAVTPPRQGSVNGTTSPRAPSPRPTSPRSPGKSPPGSPKPGSAGRTGTDLSMSLREMDEEYERETGHLRPFETNVSEVWFLGCHADVGGGAVPNDERHKLAQIPLRWMIRQCFECDTGIIFNTRALAQMGLDVHSLWPKYHNLGVPVIGPSPTMMTHYEQGLPPRHKRGNWLLPISHKKKKKEGLYELNVAELEDDETNAEWVPEQVEDYFDAMSPINDQLVVARGWWILELWPVQYKMQKTESDEWDTITGMNLGRFRGVEDKEPKLHWTVQQRMVNQGYKLQARFGRNAVWQLVS